MVRKESNRLSVPVWTKRVAHNKLYVHMVFTYYLDRKWDTNVTVDSIVLTAEAAKYPCRFFFVI